MNILLIVRWPVGGIRSYLRYVYRLFSPDQYRFSLLATPDQALNVIKDDLGERLDKIDVCSASFRQMSTKIFRSLKSGKYDLVHSHGLSSCVLAAIPAKLAAVPHVVTLHDVFSQELFNRINGRLKHFLINRVLQLADVVYLLGDDPRENLREFFPAVMKRSERIVVIKSGIEIERFSRKNTSGRFGNLRTENGISEEVQILGFFGRFMSQKGFGTLIDAIEILAKQGDKTKIPVVVAFGNGGFLEREKRMLRKKEIMGYFRFVPFLPNIVNAMSQLDGVVVPSRSETAPILPMEVLVNGTPLIASDCIGLREITQQTPAFVFKADDPLDLANTLRQWSIDPRKEEFVAFAPDAALRFDVRNTAEKLKRLYAQVASDLPIENLGKAS